MSEEDIQPSRGSGPDEDVLVWNGMVSIVENDERVPARGPRAG